MPNGPFRPILTPRVELRPLTEADVGARYLGWFSDPAAVRFIEAARSPQSMDTLRAFVRARSRRPDVWFLGIFSRGDGGIVGTLKCEPIDVDSGVAVMGILIGEERWRGVGLAREVIPAVADALRNKLGIRHLDLGVHPENVRAVRAYERIGFRLQSISAGSIRMRLSAEGGMHADT